VQVMTRQMIADTAINSAGTMGANILKCKASTTF
jgi:hypothetical protein